MIETQMKPGEIVRLGDEEEPGMFVNYISVWDNGHVEWGLHSQTVGMAVLELYQLQCKQRYSYRYVPVHIAEKPAWWKDRFHSKAIIEFASLSCNREKLPWKDRILN
jgi:hypothetical protein